MPGSRYTSGRCAALGDACLPLGDDGATALFYNPAAIGKIRTANVEPLNFSVNANSGFTGTVGTSFYKVTSLSSYAPVLAQNTGTFSNVGAAVFPNFYMKYFAFGVLMQSQLGGQANADGSYRYRSLYQFIPTATTGIRLAGGIVRLGYNLQWVNSAVGDITTATTVDPTTLGYNQQLSSGSALSHNIGFALTLPVAYLPSFNLVARNILGANYTSFTLLPLARNSPGTPANEDMSVDASFSIMPKLGQGAYMNWVLEYRDATNRSGMAFLGRLAMSAEFSFRDVFFLRGGWGDGYPDAGIGLRRKGGEFSFSWYSEEIGASYHDQRDTRFMMQYQIRAF